MRKKNHILIIAIILNEIFNNMILLGIPFRLIVLPLLLLLTLTDINLTKIKFNNQLLFLYFLYVFVTHIVTIFSGNFSIENFERRFFGYYSITLFYAILIPNIKLNFKSYKKVINFILLLGIGHCSFIILQFIGFDIFWIIPGYFSNDYIYLGNGTYSFSKKLNEISPVGLIDYTVTAGYLILIFIPFYKLFNNTINKFMFILLLLISSLLLGQRSVLIIMILYLFLSEILSNKISKQSKIIFIIMSIGVSLYSTYIDAFSNNISYKFQENLLKDENRHILYTTFQYFFSSNLWFGGLNQYFKLLEIQHFETTLPHNIFLNSFVIGGIFSLLLSIWLFTSNFKYLFKNYTDYNKSKAFYPLFGSCILIMANSLFHNQGFSTNDNLFFLIYGLSHIKITK
tara:strand:+ start:11325 stop:12521 length:1197 start_codon:yes stop_codon:yes gene_type:complete